MNHLCKEVMKWAHTQLQETGVQKGVFGA